MIKCERCSEEAQVKSFCYDDYGKKDGVEYLCGFCHSDRVNTSRGMFYNFVEFGKVIGERND